MGSVPLAAAAFRIDSRGYPYECRICILYRRVAEGDWRFDPISGPGATLTLASVGLEVPLAEVYRWVAFAVDTALGQDR